MDEAKNMALLFFMDHLMQKNGHRTIHDLSCQFGARGFTAEMRNAVGTTQEGLTEFLSQHPSLFIVEGDQVWLKGFGDITAKNNPLLQATANGRNRDYEKEAVEFFEAKLQKFGPELQIKSLLGHRSQAAPEIRLVSGRHLKDFCEFLQAQTEHFVVEGDRVRLKNMPEPSSGGIELDDEGKPLAGVKAKQAAVEYLKSVLEQNEEQPIPMDVFYQKFCDRFSHIVRQEVATNPKELLQFLKLNRNVFFIRSNKVSLVKNRPSEDGSESGSTEGSELEQINSALSNQNAMNNVSLVKALKPAQDAITLINADIDAMEEKVIGLDFKTVTLGMQGDEFLSLVVIATPSRIVAFDLVHSDIILLESGVKEILESEKVVKIMHEARRIASLLAHRYAVNLRRIFDTQEVKHELQVAHTILQHEKFGKALSDMRSISFLNLQRVYYPQSIMMSDATPRKLSQMPSWGQRPITDEMLTTIVEEAHCLLSVFYRMMNNLIPPHLRPVFDEKCIEAVIAIPNRPPPIPPQIAAPPTYRGNRRGGNSSPITNGAFMSQVPSQRQTSDASTQTFSTGEINVINVYYES